MDDQLLTKQCTRCGKTKPLTREFYHYCSTNKTGYLSHCRECENKRAREYLKNKRATDPAWRLECNAKRKAQRRRKKEAERGILVARK